MEAEKLELLNNCLYEFQERNPHAKVNFENGQVQILNPWGTRLCSSCRQQR